MRNFLMILGLLISGTLLSQEPMSVRYNNLLLTEVLSDIERKAGVLFSYNVATVRNRVVSLTQDQTFLSEVLASITEQTGLVFERISDQQIIVREKESRICGYLRSTVSSEPLPYATLIVKNVNKGTTTDERGFFEFSGLNPTDSLEIQYVGYKLRKIRVAELEGPPCQTVLLQPETQILNEVILTAYLTPGVHKNTDGSFTMIEKDLGIFPGQVEPDVLQGIQMVPGISSLDESAAGIQIRGGSPDQNLILFDGIRMYNSGHFFGMISAFNPYVIERARIYKSGARPEYGDRVSGVIDISTMDELPAGISGGAGINGTHGDLFLKTPLGSRGGLALSARRSYTDLYQTPTFDALAEKVFQNTRVEAPTGLQPTPGDDGEEDDEEEDESVLISGQQAFYFYDANAKLLLKPSPTDRVFISGLLTYNELDFSVRDDEDIASDFFTIENRGASILWDGTAGRWNYRLSTQYSSFDSGYTFEVADDDDQEASSLRGNTVEDLGADFQLGYMILPEHRLLAGYQYSKADVTFRLAYNESLEADEEEDGEGENDASDYDVSRTDALQSHTLYSEYRWEPLNQGLVSVGLRASRYNFSDEVYLEPRANIEYPLIHGIRLKASFEKRFQPISQLVEFEDIQLRLENNIWTLSNGEDIPILESLQYSGGLLWNLNGWTIDADAYVRNISGLTSFTNGFVTNPGTFAAGESDIHGIDLLLRKSIREYSFWLGYTYNKIDFRFPELATDPFPGNNDIRHQLNVAGSAAIGFWEVSLGWNYHGGAPYTPIESYNSATGSITYGPVNSLRLPEYHRLDASLLYRFGEKEGLRAEVGVAFRNIYNRRVPLSIYYRKDVNPLSGEAELNEIRQLSQGITPNAVIRVSF